MEETVGSEAGTNIIVPSCTCLCAHADTDSFACLDKDLHYTFRFTIWIKNASNTIKVFKGLWCPQMYAK